VKRLNGELTRAVVPASAEVHAGSVSTPLAVNAIVYTSL
jgi:hypothetical protein